MKTIGAPVATKSEVAPSLIVFNSRGATLQGDTLTLTGVIPNSTTFADRPVRAAGHQLRRISFPTGKPATTNFAKDPPNATVSAFSGKDGSVT